MPKRKRSNHDDEDYYHLEKKFRKLERKIRRARRRRRDHSSPPSSESTSESAVQPLDCETQDSVILGEQSPTEAPNDSEQIVLPLDDTILELLGDDPTQSVSFGPEIQKDLAIRLEHCATNGLPVDVKRELRVKYLVPINCKLINAPTLNAELKAAVTDLNAKRDKAIEIKQIQLSAALSALSQALTHLFSVKETDAVLTKLLMDASKILADCMYNDSITRRSFILSTLKKEMKDHLQATKIDSCLFGQDITETIKTAKAISKSGAELKAPAFKPQSHKKAQPQAGPSKTLNWKGPFPTRRPTEPPRTKEPAPTRSRHARQLKPSQHYRTQRYSQRR